MGGGTHLFLGGGENFSTPENISWQKFIIKNNGNIIYFLPQKKNWNKKLILYPIGTGIIFDALTSAIASVNPLLSPSG